MGKKRNMLAALVVVMAVATAGCGGQQANDTPSSSPIQTTPTEAAKPTATPSGQPTALAPDNVQLLESKLANSDKTEQALALIPNLRNGKWSSAAVLPAGSTLTIDQKTFSVASNGYATVTASVTGSVQGKFVLHLAVVDGQWLIYQLEQKR
jgi:hypothetical protein